MENNGAIWNRGECRQMSGRTIKTGTIQSCLPLTLHAYPPSPLTAGNVGSHLRESEREVNHWKLMVGMVTRDMKLLEEFVGLCGRCYNNTDFKCHRSEARACLIGVYVCVVEVGLVFFVHVCVYVVWVGGYGGWMCVCLGMSIL